MKASFYLIILFFPLVLFGQDSTFTPRSDFRPGSMWYFTGFRPAAPEKVRKYDRLVFDITYNDWMGDRELFKNHWASIGLNTNWMFDIPLAKQNVVGLGIGITHQWVNIRHDNLLFRNDTNQSTEFHEKTVLDEFNSSNYGSHSLMMPLELRFRSKGYKHFKFHMGGKIGYLFGGYSKYKVNDEFKSETKTKGFHDDPMLVYSVHARIGIRNWALFGSYQINRMFTSELSVQLNLIQFGLSISLY